VEWLFALVPVALCAGMCVGGVVLAALGIRRSRTRAACCPPSAGRDDPEPVQEGVDR
jgi:hypothetical protein